MQFDFEYNLGPDDEPVNVIVSHVSFGRPAQTYGPPERCYEAEPDDVEFTVERMDGTPYPTTAKDDDMLYDMIIERAHDYANELDCDAPDYDDYCPEDNY